MPAERLGSPHPKRGEECLAWGISLLVIGLAVSPAIIIVFGFIASTTIGLLVPMLYTYTAEHDPA